MAVLLAIQALLFWLSLGALDQISIFCTGPRSSAIAGLFGSIHLVFVALACLGVLSLRFTRLRYLYAGLILIGLASLPLQAKLVSAGQLQCDGP